MTNEYNGYDGYDQQYPPNENYGNWEQYPEDQQFNIGRGAFDKNRFTHFMQTMLKLGYIGLLLWAIISIVESGFDFMFFLNSNDFRMILVFAILGYVGNMILTGKFSPPKQDPNKPKQKWVFDPSGGKNYRPPHMQSRVRIPTYPQQRRPVQPQRRPSYQQYQKPRQQPIQKRQPQQQRRVQAPAQIQYDICHFCGQQLPVTQLKQIKQPNGNILNVCRRCLK